MKCILTNTPEFKALADVYGDALAKKYIIDYSILGRKIGPNDEYYYPTKQELKDFLTAEKIRISEKVTRALAVNPFMTVDAIKSHLAGVVNTFNGVTYVTRGFTNSGSLVESGEAIQNTFIPNLNIIKKLAERFPNIIKLEESASNEYTKVVVITPIVERAKMMEEPTQQRAEAVVDFMDRFPMSRETMDADRAQEVAQKLGDKFAKAFGIPYTMVSEAEAKAVLENSVTPYMGEAAFFYNNTVYFVGDKLNTGLVLHEFAHPLIKGIAQMNPGLFEKLYAQLKSTSKGNAIIQNVVANYRDLEFESPRFKEEVIVNALAQASEDLVNKQTETEVGFRKFILNLIYAIKQVIKKLVGKVDLAKLDANTTLDELANMMVNEDFVIDNMVLEPSDIAEFKKDLATIVAQLEKVEHTKLQDAINRVYSENRYELDILRKSPKRLKDLLNSKEGAKFLNFIKEDLLPYQTVDNPKEVDVDAAIMALADQQEEFRLRSLAIINAIQHTEVFVENIEKAISKIDADPKRIKTEEIGKVMYFKDFLIRQEDLLENVRMAIGLSKENDFIKRINGILSTIRDARKSIESVQQRFSGEWLEKSTKIMAEDIDQRFRNDITKAFKADNIDQATIDSFLSSMIDRPLMKEFKLNDYNLPLNAKRAPYIAKIVEEYNLKRLNREQYDKFLKGEGGDIGFIASMILPLKNIDDPIIGSFVRRIEIEMSNMMAKSLDQRDKIANRIDPLLKRAGYNVNNVGGLAKQILTLDTDGYRDSKTGEWVEYQRYGFSDKFVNWRYERGKIANDLENAKENKNQDEILRLKQEQAQFDEDYMHREFVDEVYEKKKIWTSTNKLVDPFTKKEITISPEVSQKAYQEREIAREKLNALRKVQFEDREEFLEHSPADEARMEYERLFDVSYPDGTPKTGEELEKVLVRKHYRSQTRKYYENKEDVESLQKDLDNFVDKMAAKGITMEENPDIFNDELEKFFRRNMNVAFTAKYAETRKDLIAQLKELTDKPGARSEIAKKRAALIEERYELTSRVIDKNRQPNGIQLTEYQRQRIKEIEVELVELEEQFDKKTGLSKEQASALEKYQNRLVEGPELTSDEMDEYNDLINIKNDMGMGPLELEKMRSIFRQLGAMSFKEPTEYYVDAINYAIRGLDLEEVTIENADEWINSAKVIDARSRSEVFEKWFVQNHYSKEVWDPDLKQKVVKIFRTSAWTVARPLDKSSYKTTTLMHPVTGEEIIRYAVPGGKYNRPSIREEFRTPRTVGVTVNNKGEWLPREYKPGQKGSAKTDKFMNKEFISLQRTNPNAFELLEALKEEYLKIQEGMGNGSKLYLDYPNFYHRTNLELAQSGTVGERISDKMSPIKYYWDNIFGDKKTPDAAEWGFNYNAEATAIGTDILGNPLTRIPIRGMYRLKHTDVSMDFLRAFMEYNLSLNTQQALSEIEPVALALRDVLNNKENGIKDLSFISKQIKKSTGALSFINMPDNKRAQLFNHIVDKIFYGKANSDFETSHMTITKIANAMMGATSRSYIAFDLVSAAKNRFGMVFQALIETAGGKYITPKSYALGKFKAFNCTVQLMTKGIYTYGPKSLDLQMMERFDPITGKTGKDFGKAGSRSFLKDMLDMSWMFDPRKLAEVEAGLEVFWGMMYNKYIDQTDASGRVTKIRYADAFELDKDGLIKLKDGIDPEWAVRPLTHTAVAGQTVESVAKLYGLTPEKLREKNEMSEDEELTEGQQLVISSNELFNDFKLKVQAVGKNLNGLIGEYESPQASKYLLFRLFSFYRLFALPQFTTRFQMDTSKENFGGEVYDFGLGTMTKGYYISAWQGIYKSIKTGGKYIAMMKDDEKVALRKVLAEGMMLAVMGLALGLLFGYDEDDKDRFKKLEQREKDWGMLGYISNHLLYQLMAVMSENQLLVPIVGFDDFNNFLDKTTLASGPVVGNMIKIMQDLFYIVTGDESALYKQDAGPYTWQEEGDYKLWNHIGGIFGIKGKNYDPIYAIKTYEQFQNLN